jgi:PIN domain nuclease of toxin-antitoxin system
VNLTADAGCVLDASALLAVLQSEPGAKTAEEALEYGAMSTVNWSEVRQRSISRGVDVAQLRSSVEALGLRIVEFHVEDADAAADLWPASRRFGLSLGDRACIALAQRLRLPVLTADRAWLDANLGVEIHAIR